MRLIRKHMEELVGLTEAVDSRPGEIGNVSSAEQLNNADIAVVGVACEYPGGVHDIESFWSMRRDGIDAMGEAPWSRWDTDSILAPLGEEDRKDLDRMRYGAFLENDVLERFPARMFGISDAEAKTMSYEQRLCLYGSYKALLDAGSSLESLVGQHVGVFVGISSITSQSIIGESIPTQDKPSVYDATKSSLSVAAGRISYALGLQGPAMAIDTACSSSLVALHKARRSLQHGECSSAVVSGVSILDSVASLYTSGARMLSSDGKCHTFDSQANGYCRGEGCGSIVLKRLSDAIRDGNGIYAVIKGSAVMQDGQSASLTAPNGRMQEQLMQAALRDAHLDPADVKYVEAHGTGTALGDPRQTAAIAEVYGRAHTEDDPLYISSAKANIGHLEAAAGIAGLMSAMLTLQHSQVAPNAQLHEMNSKVKASIDDYRYAYQ